MRRYNVCIIPPQAWTGPEALHFHSLRNHTRRAKVPMDNLDTQHRIAKVLQLMSNGDITSAARRCTDLLASTRNPVTLQLMASCLMQLDKVPEAIALLREALGMGPGDPRLWHDLGRAYSSRGQWHAAAQAYIQAIELDPGRAENYLYLGPIYEQVGDFASAERAYLRASQLNPQLATAAASLAAIYEKDNRIEDAEKLVKTALELDPTDTIANLTRAQLDYRNENYRDSAKRLKQLLDRPLSAWNRNIAASRMGTALAKLGEHEAAFAAFLDGKQALLTADLAIADTGIYASASIARVKVHMDELLDAQTEPAADNGPAPVFLLGFPRSGTTLLNQILSSHPGTLVIEEKDTLRDSLQEFVTTPHGMSRLIAIDRKTRERFRQTYWQRVAEATGEALADRQLVDKLPLYTAFIPVIRKIIPEARFILAVRDPRDVVLSCFMQAFGLNEAMRHFLRLEDTAAYYASVMEIGIHARKYLDDQIHLIKYESLIDDLEGEARRLCGFLGLPWDPAMLRFPDTANKRRINTPSYSQVVQPVYRSARGRWRHYEAQLEQVLPVLRPYLEYFGYP